MTADLHTHTVASQDSTLELSDRVSLAIEHNIDTIAITDHMAINDRLTAREQIEGSIALVTGVELNCTVDGDRIDILGYFLDPGQMREYTAGLTVSDGAGIGAHTAIEWIHDAGGGAVLAHPGRYDLDLAAITTELVEDGLDGIEIEYPYEEYTFVSSETPPMPNTPVDEIEAIADSHDLIRTGGSDCHGGEKTYMGTVRIEQNRVDELREVARAYR